MKNEYTYNNQERNLGEDADRLSRKMSVEWTEPKEAIWQRMASQLDRPAPRPKVILWQRPTFRLAVAALLLVLFSVAGVMRFYRASYETGAGQQLLVSLPDGSTVKMNAGSSLNFYPYWWAFSRELAFRGEGYFEVEKGRRFAVVSSQGTTTVVGTSFTVFARDEAYRVACLSGKVKVADADKQHEVLLEPNQKVALTDGQFVKTGVKAADETAWTRNQFLFAGTPIREVFDEIERQYGVQIVCREPLQNVYTGNFSRDLSVEEVLNFVCKPFHLNFEKQGVNEYRISKIN